MPLKVTYLTPQFAIATAPRAEDFADLANAGFGAVVNNRPDGEDPAALTAEAGRAGAAKAGLGYRHLPAESHSLFDPALVDAFEETLAELPGPVVAHCKTGTRSAVLWAQIAVRTQPVAGVLRILAKAGYDVAYLASELEEQAAAYRAAQGWREREAARSHGHGSAVSV